MRDGPAAGMRRLASLTGPTGPRYLTWNEIVDYISHNPDAWNSACMRAASICDDDDDSDGWYDRLSMDDDQILLAAVVDSGVVAVDDIPDAIVSEAAQIILANDE